MKAKLPIFFIVALLVGLVGNWTVAKINWLVRDQVGTKFEEQASSSNVAATKPTAEVVRVIPQGVSLSPSAAYLEKPPSEIAVTFPFVPKAGGLSVQRDEVTLTSFEDDAIIIRDKALVYQLPTSSTSGVYSIDYKGCPGSSSEGCIEGTFGFAVK